MLKTYTEAEMLRYWKQRLGLRGSSRVTPGHDLTELDLKLLDDIELWYADLLERAPADKVPTANLATETSAHRLGDNSAEILLPRRGVRLVAVKMAEWKFEETETVSPYSDIASLQRNRLTSATTEDPVVIERRDRIEVHGLDPNREEAELESLVMVVAPAEGTYVLDPTLMRHDKLLIH